MPNMQELKPGCFVTVKNSFFARRKDGKICLASPSNVIFDCTKKEKVNLISVSLVQSSSQANSSKSINVWSFWQIENRVYPLNFASSVQKYIEMPEDVCFVGFYVNNQSSKNDVEIFVKYFASNNYGIIRFKNNSIDHLISSEDGYSEIEYEKGYFYGVATTGRWKYKVLNCNGTILHEFLTNRRLLKGSELSYDSTRIYNDYTGVEIPDGIESAYIITEGNFNFIVVKNASGIFYYSFNLEYILGPIVYDFIQVQENFCYVAEMLNKKFTKIFCIKYLNKNKYICSSIESKNGIKYHSFQNVNFFMKNGSLYVLRLESMEFELLFEENETDSFTFSENNFKDCIDIVCFKNGIPICMAIYDLTCNTIVSRNNLEVIGESYDKSIFVCQLQVLNSPIFGINKEGKLIFSV